MWNDGALNDYLDHYLKHQLSGDHSVDELSRSLLAAGGKRIRSRLTLELAAMMDVAQDVALPWAAANEMLHSASLVHDDIQDRDLHRRGRPTLWSEHGVEVAISVGDHLLMKPFCLVNAIALPPETRVGLAQLICDAVSRMAVAQVQERLLLKRLGESSVTPHYLEVISGKTSALFELPVAGLSLIAGQDEDERARLVDSFRRLGHYFQILDDLKDVLGMKGKPERGADLREGKVSALVSAYLELRPHHAERLGAFLSGPRREAAGIAHWLGEFETAGAIDATWAWLEKLWAEFEDALPHTYGRQGLSLRLSEWMGPAALKVWRTP